MAAGRKVAGLARDLGVSDRRPAAGRLEDGLSTLERAELAAAKRRIRELEAELAGHRRPWPAS